MALGVLGNPDRVGPVPEVALEVLLVCVHEKEQRKIVIPRRESTLYSLQASANGKSFSVFCNFCILFSKMLTRFLDKYLEVFELLLNSLD